MPVIRTRIAPSPTGNLHLGTARTALFNYLFARKNKGVFVLRIEDTDLARSDKKYEKDIIDGLKWLGIEWDEGIDIGGNCAPYRQSERLTIYSKYIQKLLNEDKAFYCWHTKEELDQEKEEQIIEKKLQRHICGHKNFQFPIFNFQTNPKSKIQNQKQETKKAIIRLNTPSKKIVFKDLIRGEVEFNTALLGDISIAKSINEPLYNFAVVIDDYEMKISHVIRGEDHISNTPKQILIQEALGFPTPQYAHLPLILGPDRSKLSKRHGAVSINWYREQGYLPEAMVNFMALLGWSPQSAQGGQGAQNKEIFSIEELISEFSIEKIQKSGAIFNMEKLDWINGQYIRKLSIDKLVDLCIPYIKSKIKNQKSKLHIKNQNEYFKKIIKTEQERLKKISDIAELADFFFKEKLEYDRGLLKWKNMNDEELKDILEKIYDIFSAIPEKDFTKEKLEPILKAEAAKAGDNGKIFWPLRVALSGKKASPGPLEIAEILGKQKSAERVKLALDRVLLFNG